MAELGHAPVTATRLGPFRNSTATDRSDSRKPLNATRTHSGSKPTRTPDVLSPHSDCTLARNTSMRSR
jgi:hypothetical protein